MFVCLQKYPCVLKTYWPKIDVFVAYVSVLLYENDLKFGKEVKPVIVVDVDTSLHNS